MAKHREAVHRIPLNAKRGPVWIAVVQRDADGRDKILFSVSDRLGVATTLGAIVEHKATEAAAFQYIDRITSEVAASDAAKLARIGRAMAMK